LKSAGYYNKVHKRTGTLWEGRFKSSLVGSDNYFLIVSRYIELNPVRAKMVAKPEEYSWSSYHHNALNKTLKLITAHSIHCGLGDSNTRRAKRYVSLFDEHLTDSKLNEIRCVSSRSWVLGEESFKLKLEKESGVSIIFNQWGGVRAAHVE